jgi:hypothetical protein
VSTRQSPRAWREPTVAPRSHWRGNESPRQSGLPSMAIVLSPRRDADAVARGIQRLRDEVVHDGESNASRVPLSPVPRDVRISAHGHADIQSSDLQSHPSRNFLPPRGDPMRRLAATFSVPAGCACLRVGSRNPSRAEGATRRDAGASEYTPGYKMQHAKRHLPFWRNRTARSPGSPRDITAYKKGLMLARQAQG